MRETGPKIDTIPGTPSAAGQLLRSVGRGLAVVTIWLVALGIASGGFFPGPRQGRLEVIAFGLSFALASAVAGVATLAVGGRGRLAIEAAVAIVATVLVAMGVVWLAPFTTQRLARLGSQELLFYRRKAVAFVRDWFPTGPILGLVIGTLAGLLMRLGRRRPRVAAALAVGLLVAVAASASDAGRLVSDFVLESRKARDKWTFPSLDPIEVAGSIGSAAGSVFGAIAACAALRASRDPSPTKPIE